MRPGLVVRENEAGGRQEYRVWKVCTSMEEIGGIDRDVTTFFMRPDKDI